MINKKKLQSGLKIIAFIFPFIFIGPSLFLRGSMSGFDDVDSKKPIHSITPNNNILEDSIYPLPIYKFTGIEILYIYINSNLGEEKTRINYLDLNGKINTYMKNKGVVNCVYEVSPQISDHKIDNDSKGNIII